eukprot:COSAG05_NODE_13335_length_434_cov_0.737313_2_plen_21_part_01
MYVRMYLQYNEDMIGDGPCGQ